MTLEALREEFHRDPERVRRLERIRNGIRSKWEDCVAGPGQEPKEGEWVAPEKWVKRAFAGWGVSLIACPWTWCAAVFGGLLLIGGRWALILRAASGKYGVMGVRLLAMTLGASLLMSWLCRVVPEDTILTWYLGDPEGAGRKLRWTHWRTFIFRRFSFVSVGWLGVVGFIWWGCKTQGDITDSPWFFPWIWTWITAFMGVGFQNLEEVAVIAAPPEPQPFGSAPPATGDDLAGLL
jgi:hypothetical protein